MSSFRSYHPTLRRVLTAGFLAAALAATLYAVRKPLAALCRAHVALLFSRSHGRFATADDRAAWTARHPGELRVALVGRANDPRIAAFEVGVRRVNEQGGVNGRRLDAVRIDPGAAPDGLQVALTRLACDPSYFALFAAFSADPLLALKPILLQGRLITFAPGVTNGRATRPDEIPYVFLPNASDADIAAEFADLIRRTEHPGLVVCHEDTEEGRGLGEELQKAFQRRAMPNLFRIPFACDVLGPHVQSLVAATRDFHGIDHVAYLRAKSSGDAEAIRWLLRTFPGKIVLARPPEGDWSEAEKARFLIARTMPDPEVAAKRSIELFAEAVRRARTLHPDAVIGQLLSCFTESRFM